MVLLTPGAFRNRPAAPVGFPAWRPSQGDADHARHRAFVVGGRTSPAGGILLQAGDPGSGESLPPEAHRRLRTAQSRSDAGGGDPLGGQEHDPSAEHLPLGQRTAARPGGQDVSLDLGEEQCRSGMIGHAAIILAPHLIRKLFADRCTSDVSRWSFSEGGAPSRFRSLDSETPPNDAIEKP